MDMVGGGGERPDAWRSGGVEEDEAATEDDKVTDDDDAGFSTFSRPGSLGRDLLVFISACLVLRGAPDSTENSSVDMSRIARANDILCARRIAGGCDVSAVLAVLGFDALESA